MAREKPITILLFKGQLTFNTIEELLDLYREKIKDFKVDLVVQKRLYSILVESLENTIRHQFVIDLTLTHKPVELLLVEDKNEFKVSVGNYIDNRGIDHLTERITMVNSLDLEGLNKLYRESISKARISDKGGAGLGIIEIARNSRQKLIFELLDSQKDYSFFNLIVTVNKCY